MPTFPKEKLKHNLLQEKQPVLKQSDDNEKENMYTDYGYLGAADHIEYCTWLEAYEANPNN